MENRRDNAKKDIEAWNQAHSVGVKVTVRLYHGAVYTSRTSTKARISEMGDAVIETDEIEGVIGNYFLLRNVMAI